MTKKNFVFSFAIPLICTIFAMNIKIMLMQTIDTYKLTSMEVIGSSPSWSALEISDLGTFPSR